MTTNPRRQARLKRQRRIRKHLSGTTDRPRLNVFRSSRHIYAQVIDDTRGLTLAHASSLESAVRDQPKFENKVAVAAYVGKLVAQRAMEKGVTRVVFDRGGFLYHGRVKAVSEGAREAGLEL